MSDPTEPAVELCPVCDAPGESCGHRDNDYGVTIGKKHPGGEPLALALCACGCVVMTRPSNEGMGAECKTCRDEREANPLHQIPPPRNQSFDRKGRIVITVLVLIVAVWLGSTISSAPSRPMPTGELS